MKVLKLSVLVIICTILWADVSAKRANKNKRSAKIVGDEVAPHSLPYMAAIRTRINERAVLCGGSLVTPSLVLTAAKCVDGATEAEVILGAHNLDEVEETQVRLTSSKFIIYNNYDRNAVLHNLALIQLPSPVTLNENIATISIDTDSTSDYNEQLGLVAGWGKAKDSDTTFSSVLREIDVSVIPNLACDIVYFFTIQSSQMCTTGVDKKDICLGDAGSPLVINGAQVGIVSFGSDYGCEVGLPAVHTRLARYVNWLKVNIDASS